VSAFQGIPPAWAPSFPDLVGSSRGRHPIELLAELTGDRSAVAQRLAREASVIPVRQSPMPQGDGLALPHPLDSEWRFNADTAHGLVMRTIEATKPGDTILLLGVPTVVLAAAETDADRSFVVACEENIIGVGLMARIACDPRFQDPVAANCAAAIVDPPWYPKMFAGLLGQAAAACRVGGTLFIGAPPLGVRPTSEVERHEALATAADIGLALVIESPEKLVYRTPAFEQAAMEAAGLRLQLPTWRHGDLLVFRKDRSGRSPALPPAPPAFELTLNGIRLRLLAGPTTASKLITPIAKDEVFPSVSTRAPGRAGANLWTSGNRAFRCPPAATLTALQLLAAENDLWPKRLGPMGKESVDSTSIDPIHLIPELARIAARDHAHMAALVGVSSWNQAANDARFLNGSAATFRQTLLGVAA